jgi:hypothetical protein
MKKIKAYLVYFLTGWKSVEVFGNPDSEFGTFIACLQNNAVMELNFSSDGNISRWWRIGIGDIQFINPVMYWRPLPKHP